MESQGIEFGSGKIALRPSPINPVWILQGEPQASNRVLSRSADGAACTLVWECSAGRFNWFYDIDETIYVLEGAVTLRDHKGGVCRLEAGDTAFFPAGSHAEWNVEERVRKIAFCRSPLPRPVQFAARAWRACRRLLALGRRRHPGHTGPKMFGVAPPAETPRAPG